MTTLQVRILVYTDAASVHDKLLDLAHPFAYNPTLPLPRQRLLAMEALGFIKRLIQFHDGFDIPAQVIHILKNIFGTDAPRMIKDLKMFMDEYQFCANRVVKKLDKMGWGRAEGGGFMPGSGTAGKEMEGMTVGQLCKQLGVGAWVEMVRRHWELR